METEWTNVPDEDESDDGDFEAEDDPWLDDATDIEAAPLAPAARYHTRETTTTTHATVICKLATICRLPELVSEIQRVAFIMKQVQVEGWHFANFHVLRCLHAGVDVPNVSQMFFYHCCSAVLDNQTSYSASYMASHPEFRASWHEYRRGRTAEASYEAASLLSGTRMINEVAKMMFINAKNMLTLNFRKRLHQYIRFRYAAPGKLQLSYKETKRIVDSCYRVLTQPVLDTDGQPTDEVTRLWNEWDTAANSIERDLRLWLGIVPWQFNIEKNSGHFIKRLHNMLTWMEAFVSNHPKQKGAKLYTLLPLSRSYQVAYVKINASTLYELFARLRSQHPCVERFIVEELGFTTATSTKRKRPSSIDQRAEKRLRTLPDSDVHRGVAPHPDTVSAVGNDDPGDVGPLKFCMKTFQDKRSMVLRKVFDVVRFETKTRKFADELSTNGYGASVCMTHPVTTIAATEIKKKPSKKNAENAPAAKTPKTPRELFKAESITKELAKLGPNFSPDVLVGIDPGIRSLATAVSVGHLHRRRRKKKMQHGRRRNPRRRKCSHRNRRRKRGRQQRTRRARNARRKQRQRGKRVTQITTREYYHLARINDFNFWLDHVKKRDPWYAAVSTGMPCFKTASYSLYRSRMRYFWMHLPFLLHFTAEQSFLRCRFTRDRFKMKALAKLAKRLIPQASKRVCVGLGDWSQQGGMRGHPHAPVKSFASELRKRATVISIDEFRTSALCSGCHKRMKQARLLTQVKRKKDEVDIRVKLFPSRKEATEIEAMRNMSSRKLASKKMVLKCTRNVLRCATSRCKATLLDRDINAATNILELLRSSLKGKHGARRLRAFKR